MLKIRPAIEADLPTILEIYNDAVLNSTAIWIETPADLDDRRAWLAARTSAGFPVLVADSGPGKASVLGYGSFGEFRAYEGFRYTVEHSVYVTEEAQGRGVGKMLLRALIEEARGMGKRVMVGAIDASNYASLALHETMGFEETGRMPGVGEKFGKRLDMVLVQLVL
ncbi:phosphinothricin acetyltransferase [Pseudorhodoplanes sinuspersici]|uniref:GNAT family N-acetyltransferase n=1 Tax=Pseudorhodoplanes sinuspersici TaxID=1235591 RepID=A0A1W6ZNJ1_9HYPH|nr:GNAT family N-acetyltransferase [Pseudorhodoplanes sinuspersici]RKE69549.1 phosphinothricin acetyltransferase [Pseudorhodoplanes sinuspersici]